MGSGDSIIIESNSDNDNLLGIIDCHKLSGINPTLELLKQKRLDKLDFILWSHPHADHYNGLLEVLEYCESKNINITFFGFTVEIDPKILSGLLNNSVNENKLAGRIYRKANELEKSGLIEHRVRVCESVKNIIIDKDYELNFLAPNQLEMDEYLTSVIDNSYTVKEKTDPNQVSLVTCIESDTNYILLTSDTTKNVLKRIGIKTLKKTNKKLILGQVPHHGSIHNHSKEFWKRLKYDKKTPLAISVGINDKTKPSPVVVSDLTNLDYDLKMTSMPSENTNGFILDDFSERASQPDSIGDIVFEF